MCPACKGAGGEDWRELGWANCTRCNGVGTIPADDIYWATLASFAERAAA